MNTARHSAIPVEFGGKTRHLIYDFNALAELEDLAGTFSSESPRLKVIRAAVWAGLLSETLDGRGKPTKNTLSLMEVGEILGGMKDDEIEALAQKIVEARALSDAPAEPRPTTATENPPELTA